MNEQSFTTTVTFEKSPWEIFEHLTRDVPKWWGGKDFKGNSVAVNDEFTIHHPGTHFSRQRVVEIIPDKKVVWLVTESKFDWLERNKEEWTNTKMIFELNSDGYKTTLHFTHEGLVPDLECYDRISEGWDTVIRGWLYQFVNTGESYVV
ncbi:MAG: SRPBCC domain-containing protein [Flavipsychrobacter sp.]